MDYQGASAGAGRQIASDFFFPSIFFVSHVFFPFDFHRFFTVPFSPSSFFFIFFLQYIQFLHLFFFPSPPTLLSFVCPFIYLFLSSFLPFFPFFFLYSLIVFLSFFSSLLTFVPFILLFSASFVFPSFSLSYLSCLSSCFSLFLS